MCTHTSHGAEAGGERVGDRWVSSEASAYPSNLNHYIAQAIASLHVAHQPVKPQVAASSSAPPDAADSVEYATHSPETAGAAR